jgi:hypothetical protein
MTLVLADAGPWYGLMVSDRLVTLSRGGAFAGRYDTVANKTVVFLTYDALVAFGYTGSAYIEGLPTDQWLAEILWGAPITPNPHSGELPFMRRGRRPGPHGFNANLLQIRRGLAETPEGDRVTILAAGWRIRRRRLTPVLIEFGAWRGAGAEPKLAMRPPRRTGRLLGSVGAEPSLADCEAAFIEGGPAPMDAPSHAAWMAKVLTSIIRSTAARTPTVGRHVMIVTLEAVRRRVACRFEPYAQHHAFVAHPDGGLEVPAAFSPWLVTDYGFNAAQLISGPSALSFPMGGWTFEISAATAPSPMDTPVFVMAQPRAPPPRRSH